MFIREEDKEFVGGRDIMTIADISVEQCAEICDDKERLEKVIL